MSDRAQGWWIPAYQPDRYEYNYQKTLVEDMPAVHTPLTIEINPDAFIAIHEAELYNYGAMVLNFKDEHLVSEIKASHFVNRHSSVKDLESLFYQLV